MVTGDSLTFIYLQSCTNTVVCSQHYGLMIGMLKFMTYDMMNLLEA